MDDALSFGERGVACLEVTDGVIAAHQLHESVGHAPPISEGTTNLV